MRKIVCGALVGSLLVASGCAKRSENIPAAYASPLTYKHLSCPDIASEAKTLSHTAFALMDQQDMHATSDAIMAGVGVAVFLPAMLFVHGPTSTTSVEVARLKGEMNALELMSAQKHCPVKFELETASGAVSDAPPPEPPRKDWSVKG